MHRGHHQARRRALAGHVGDHEPEPVARERHEVVVVAADVKAGAALAGDVEARDPRRALGQQALLDAAGDLQIAVLALLLDAHPVQARPLERRLRLAHERGREVQVLGERLPRTGTGAHRQQARELARRQQRDDEGELAAATRRAGPGRQLGHEPRPRQVAGERRGVARQVHRQRAGPGPARVAELEAGGRGGRGRARDARKCPITVVITRRSITSSSRLAVSSRPMSKRLWSWYTLTERCG